MMKLSRRCGRALRWGSGLAAVSLLLSACGAGTSSASTKTTATSANLTVAVVSNPLMIQMEKLTSTVFEKEHPKIHVKFDTLPENQERSQILKDIATNSHLFDVAMISNYETPIFAKDGYLTNLSSTFITKDPGYDVGDLLKPIAESLSYKGALYSVPFYGESSMLYYRKSLLAKAGVTMPLHPTWQQVAAAAAKVNTPSTAGICLRGEEGWGENLATIDTVINTFGGSWFNMKWQPQLTSAATEKAVKFYVHLVRTYGEPGAASDGFTGNLTLYDQGKCAMWYDSTVAAPTIASNAPAIFKDTGISYAPVEKTKYSGWLYSWSLGIPKDSLHKAAAWTWLSWATGPHYASIVAKKFGWVNAPPGTRTSTYDNPNYQKAAKAFAGITLSSMDHADPAHPTVMPVPYTGVQFVDIPQFEGLGDTCSRDIAGAIAGTESVSAALSACQQAAVPVGKQQSGG
jgi:sorbitol/mannitol transport system substrate-binding protein